VTTTRKKATDVAPESAWFKSSYSSGSEGNCVEAARLPGRLGVRDSKKPEGPALLFPQSSWATFVGSLCSGEFDTRA
jgi:hypothetical protein